MLLDKPQLSESLSILPRQKDHPSVCLLPPTSALLLLSVCPIFINSVPFPTLTLPLCSDVLVLENNDIDFLSFFVLWHALVFYKYQLIFTLLTDHQLHVLQFCTKNVYENPYFKHQYWPTIHFFLIDFKYLHSSYTMALLRMITL